MKLTLGRKILLGFIVCTLVLFGVAIFSYKNSEKFIESNEWVDHTNQVIHEFDLLMVYSIDAQTGARGFVITGEISYLEPFSKAKVNLFEHLYTVKELTRDNDVQQKNIEELEKEFNRHINYLSGYIEIRKTDWERARQIVKSGEGEMITNSIRKLIGRSKELEEHLLIERRKTSDEDARNFNIVFAALLLIIVLVLVSVYIIIINNLRALRKSELETANRNWLLTGNTELNSKMQGEKEINELAGEIINHLAPYMGAQIGAIYVAKERTLDLVGTYAFHHNNLHSIKFGEGLVGQAALEKKVIVFNEIPKDYIKIQSATGNIQPKNILIFPFEFAGKLKGVIELGSVKEFTSLEMQFIKLVAENISITFNLAQSRARLKELLEESQRQTEELQAQQEEMKQLNEELEMQANSLKQQQEELQVTNEELEEQTQSLELKNREIESAKLEIEQAARQIELSSKYKSEFLANMSHELRTPLNSLLILSKDLADNKPKNLSPDQVESAEIIYKGGNDLLALINEVLDLAKIEAGKMSLSPENIFLKQFSEELHKTFKRHAEQKNLDFHVKLSHNLPSHIISDRQRLNQILKNLLSNAIKFTDKGNVTLSFEPEGKDRLRISVADSGIGIPEQKQKIIFEAFQQAEGGTSRKYGGTGLGLSISRELAKLLNAEITLSSKPNEGSTFTLILPLEIQNNSAEISTIKTPEQPAFYLKGKNNFTGDYPSISDDRNSISKKDKIILVIDDDLKFAEILRNQAKQKGFKCLAASTGEEGLRLAQEYIPHAIILDLMLPGISGKDVLANLKSEPTTRHIPVHIVSVEERSLDLIKDGAVEFLTKPVYKDQLDDVFVRIENFIMRKVKNLLIVEDDENSRKVIRKLIGNGDVKCYEAGTGKEALLFLENETVDCIILDLGLPDISGFDLIRELEKLKNGKIPPIVVYTGRELSKEENYELQKYAESVIIKGVKSEERLLDETALFLHRTISNLPEPQKNLISGLYDKEKIFLSKKILLVDDDMRNLFAVSKILKEHSMEIIKAENGIIALDMLTKHPDTDMVLMDIMMPEMDGYETMRRIRQQDKFRNLPIIALTAKAMKDDKQKCLDAGANEYIAKPIDMQRLLSLMRVWLSK